MPSELADRIYTAVLGVNADQPWPMVAIDIELHELRECIEELGAALHKHLHADVLVTFAQCSHSRCRRAYGLTQRLHVDGGKENDVR